MKRQSTKPEPFGRRSTRVVQSKIGRYIRGEITADLIHKSNVQVVCTADHIVDHFNGIGAAAASTTAANLPANTSQYRQRTLTNAAMAMAAAATAAAPHTTTTTTTAAAAPTTTASAATVAETATRARQRPPFRNTVNARGTSFVSAISEMKRMRLNETKYAAVNGAVCASKSPQPQKLVDVYACLAPPDVPGVCLCEYEAVKKFVPEPGAYLLAIKRKLSHVRNRNVADREMCGQVPQTRHDDTGENNENFEIWQCN